MSTAWDISPIPGGVYPSENKEQSLKGGLQQLPLPQQFILPLTASTSSIAKPVVAVGDTVLKGQLLASLQGSIGYIHAPTSGLITALDKPSPIAQPAGSDFAMLPCIHLESDGEDRWRPLSPIENYRLLSPQELLLRLSEYGLVGMGGAGFPTSMKLNSQAPIDTLIINGSECEPYITADHRLVLDFPEKVIAGIDILSHCLGNPSRIILGVENNKLEIIAGLEKAITSIANSQNSPADPTPINIVSFPVKYPSGGEKQLIQILTAKEVPSGKLPLDLGIMVFNVATAAAAFDAICQDRPLISRITTVVGQALSIEANFELLIGTPIEAVLSHCGYRDTADSRIIVGGPMMGYTITNRQIPVVKTTNCLLVPTATELPLPGPELPCIRCGFCSESCPASLLPQQLLWFSQSQNFDQLQQHNLFDCIECGACSYVCPSNIPLVQYYRASKAIIRKADTDKQQADHSRKRFEFRKVRIEKEKAAKEQRRKERRQLAQSESEQQLIQQAIERSKAKATVATTAEDNQLTLLNSQIRTLEETVARYQKQLASTESTHRQAAIGAALKDAQARLQKLQGRRHQLENSK